MGKRARKPKKFNGLPGKSFHWVISIDYYINMALSILSNSEFFDSYVASQITYLFRYNDRCKVLDDYLDYMVIYDEHRIFSLKKILKRSSVLKLLVDLSNQLSEDTPENQLNNYIMFGKNYHSMVRVIPVLNGKIDRIYQLILARYLTFIVKGLMKGRKGAQDPLSLYTDAYDILMEMLDNFDPKRSKIPFNNYLKFFIKKGKNTVIKRQTLHSREKSFTVDEIESILWHDRKNVEYSILVDKVLSYMPNNFNALLSNHFNIINPLTQEELRLM